MHSIPILILAAGASMRMGGKTKQLLPWAGTTLLGHAIQQATQVSETVVVVLGAKSELIEQQVPNQVETIVNPNWEQGIGSSISVGVGHILNLCKTMDGVLIMLGDQPFLDADYLQKLVRGFNNGEHAIVATSYGKKMGVPAIFSPSVVTELSGLNQDVGAKQIIEKYADRAKGMDPEGKEIDVDTMETYHRLYASNH
ncbi:nucleotidyltransferase family protein [Allomuricauda taeanensis]|uniref:nucleotidyltransferase family protein n=1 Tax=Flagellimonas taeanensis TaxID=1005926 RepID=UPI002E7B743F|nr:nucleotidyltransferase family protein [Allomuricauda taeanensis]MEE1963439.1 nucleotidyltransferase family protein [Allomuricauda taeanensis]